MERFAKRLRELRDEKGLSLSSLANTIGVTGAILSMYENCKRAPTLPILLELADFFGVSLDYLAGRED